MLSKRARILVIDDDISIRKVLEAILTENSYVVDAVETGKEAIEKTCNNYYNLALIDIRLPDMAGTELLERLCETTPKMRKVIVTGYPTLDNAVKAINKGADAYIIKPFEVKQLLQTVEDQLQKQEQEKRYSEKKVAEFIESRVKELSNKENTKETNQL